ncbi:MAG: sugar phosphate isomerase/epimerase [Oscillospiraceae bacterium]|nr:sugar phosphate isomerase/epimerase [Oscillospiraceae bacterium]
MLKIEASGASFSCCADRFVVAGYREGLDAEAQLNKLSEVKGLDGIPIMVPLEYRNLSYIKNVLADMGKAVGTVAPDTYINPKWKDGSLSSLSPSVRKSMVDLIKESMDICAEFEGSDVLLWMAHDGYTYPFEADYEKRMGFFKEGLSECCEYRSDVKLSLEYKRKEPKTYQYISCVGKSLCLCDELKYDNLGVVVDFGHALYGGENPAESIYWTQNRNKLFHVHMNDNYRGWDDDLIPGSVSFWETLEFFWALKQTGYNGWVTIDIFPSHIDGDKALQLSVDNVIMYQKLTDMLPSEQMKALQSEGKTADVLKLVKETLWKI